MSRSKVVFVGNIPYEMTEEQIVDIMKEVGPVHSFKLMFDRDTGRSRGYGFCEYADPETAASAMRNLNGYAVGDRQLRVDKADQEFPSQLAPGPMGPSHAHAHAHHAHHAHAHHPPPSHAQPPPQSSQPSASPLASIATPSTEAITAVLSAMSNAQMLEVLSQIKKIAIASPEQTRQLLASNPALAYALLQALMNMGLVDPMMVQRIVQSMPPPVAAPPTGTSQPTPPVGAEQQRALISQIMSLTMEQIDALPPQQRDQILQLRAQLMQSQGR